MELKKLDKRVLKLWYIRAAIIALALIGVFVSVNTVLIPSRHCGLGNAKIVSQLNNKCPRSVKRGHIL